MMALGMRQASSGAVIAMVALACAAVGSAFRADAASREEFSTPTTSNSTGLTLEQSSASLAQVRRPRQDGLPENLVDVWPPAWKKAFKPEVELSSSELSQVVDASVVTRDGVSDFHVAVKVRVGDTVMDIVRDVPVGNVQAGWYMDNEERALWMFKGPPFLTVYNSSRYLFREPNFGPKRHVLITAMELARGPSMETILAQGSFDTETMLQLFLELLFGMKTMYEFGHLHRGIKPENILVVGDCQSDARCHIRLIDFAGVCSFSPDGPWFPHPCDMIYAGTPAYLPPEVLAPPSEPKSMWDTGTSDVWSAGIILYRIMCNGRVPADIEPLANEADAANLNLADYVLDIKKDQCFGGLRRKFWRKHPLRDWAPLLADMLQQDPQRRLNPHAAFRRADGLAKAMQLRWSLDTPPAEMPHGFELKEVDPEYVQQGSSARFSALALLVVACFAIASLAPMLE